MDEIKIGDLVTYLGSKSIWIVTGVNKANTYFALKCNDQIAVATKEMLELLGSGLM